jgi:dTDP-4-dehydrorhamnose reductase
MEDRQMRSIESKSSTQKTKTLRILVFGQTGQVATELRRQGSGGQGPGGVELICMGRDDADLSRPAECAAILAKSGADAVINAAAYTAVDAAENDGAMAMTVNGDAPTAMAGAAAKLGIPFVHISTDYVFDGSGDRPWRPDDAPNPLGVYGRSKLAGEDGVRAAGGVHVILRTSWVFSAHGGNFVKTMLRLGQTRDTLSIVADQIGGPTPASEIAAACLTMAQMLVRGQGQSGTYHFAGTPDVSWADFAREIFAQAGLTVDVTDIPGSDYPTLAARPANSRLDCSSLMTTFGINRPDWRRALTDVLNELSEMKT